MVADLERIADGELDHPLPTGRSAELGVLRRSIDRMTARLKERLSAFQASVHQVREQHEALEVRVEERTPALAEANAEAHLSTGIMTHDSRSPSPRRSP